MPRVLALSLCAALAACGKTEPGAPAAVATAPIEAARPAAAQPVVEADVAERLDVAVDEPLPPFEDDSGIRLISTGSLQPTDTGFEVSGTVLVYEAPDGSRLLRLENLSTPKDVHLDLALARAEKAPERIGPLKGPSGNMNYLLDAAVDLGAAQAIVLVETATQRIVASAPRGEP